MSTASRRSATSSGASASYVAELVPDGATLQMGIGAIPTAVGAGPARASATSASTPSCFTDAGLDLVEAGAVTGAAKEINRGKIVTAFLMGSQRLYDFVDDNPMIEMRPVDYTNDTSVIRRFRRMVGDQLGDLDRPDRPGQRRLDRDALLLRCRRPDGLHARRRAGTRGPGDHRPALDGCRRLGLSDRRRCWRRARASSPAAPMSGRW